MARTGNSTTNREPFVSPYRNLGMRAVSPMHSVGLHCDHCMVEWGGCAAECCCPECGAPKAYYDDGRCMCERCEP